MLLIEIFIYLYIFLIYPQNLVQSRAISVPSPVDFIGLKLFTKDINRQIVELDSTQYELNSLFNNSIIFFNLNENSKCVMVKHQNTMVWSRDSNHTSIDLDGKKEFPRKISYNIRPMVMFVYFKEQYLGYAYLDNIWKLMLEKEYIKSFGLVNSLVHDSVKNEHGWVSSGNINNDLAESRSSKYTVIRLSDRTILTFADNFKPKVVKIDRETVWKFNSQKDNGETPISLIYNSPKDRAILVFEDKLVKFIKDDDGKWRRKRYKKIKNSNTSKKVNNNADECKMHRVERSDRKKYHRKQSTQSTSSSSSIEQDSGYGKSAEIK